MFVVAPDTGRERVETFSTQEQHEILTDAYSVQIGGRLTDPSGDRVAARLRLRGLRQPQCARNRRLLRATCDQSHWLRAQRKLRTRKATGLEVRNARQR